MLTQIAIEDQTKAYAAKKYVRRNLDLSEFHGWLLIQQRWNEVQREESLGDLRDRISKKFDYGLLTDYLQVIHEIVHFFPEAKEFVPFITDGSMGSQFVFQCRDMGIAWLWTELVENFFQECQKTTPNRVAFGPSVAC